MINIHFPPSFNLTSLSLITALPVFGFLASVRWQRFLKGFIHLSAFLFVLSPSLLLLSRSQLLFLVLYTLNAMVIRMMLVVFPFISIDLYWRKNPGTRGYWVWLLSVSIHLFNANALTLAGLFRASSRENGYLAVLLSLAAIAFYFLSMKGIGGLKAATPAVIQSAAVPPDAIPSKSLEESFKERGLSEREAEVAILLAHEGLSDKEVGERLFISPLTVRGHVTHIFQKFGVKKRAEFMAKVLKK